MTVKAKNTRRASLDALKNGIVPVDTQELEQLTAGSDLWLDLFLERYLQCYILLGGSKVKFLIGKEGVGKTHHLHLLSSRASALNYLPIYLNADQTRLQRIDILYQEIVARIDLLGVVRQYCEKVVQEIAGGPLEYKADSNLSTVLAKHLDSLPLANRQIQQKLTELLRDPSLYRYFSVAIMQLAQHMLGLRTFTSPEYDALYAWLKGQKVPAGSLRQLLIFARPDRYNSRDMLRSLFSFVRKAGYSGIVVCIDSMEALVTDARDTARPMYSRLARDDAYEMIRQLIDEADRFESVVFVFAARPELFSDAVRGIRSYYALWLRVQDEIVLRRFNKLADRVNLDTVLDPPSPNSPEDKLIRAIFGEENPTDDLSPTSDEQLAIHYLSQVTEKVAVLGGCKPLTSEKLLTILRAKGPASPVKRVIIQTLK